MGRLCRGPTGIVQFPGCGLRAPAAREGTPRGPSASTWEKRENLGIVEVAVDWSERGLIRRLRRGDDAACRELIRRHHSSVYAYLRHLGADASKAADLTQETYLKAWQAIGRLRKIGSLRAWLLRIARNEFLQSVRTPGPKIVGLDLVNERAGTGRPSPEILLSEEQDRQLRHALSRLEAGYREILTLHYFQDLSLKQAAGVLGIPVGTAKSRLHRALEALRGVLGEETRRDEDHGKQQRDESPGKAVEESA